MRRGGLPLVLARHPATRHGSRRYCNVHEIPGAPRNGTVQAPATRPVRDLHRADSQWRGGARVVFFSLRVPRRGRPVKRVKKACNSLFVIGCADCVRMTMRTDTAFFSSAGKLIAVTWPSPICPTKTCACLLCVCAFVSGGAYRAPRALEATERRAQPAKEEGGHSQRRADTAWLLQPLLDHHLVNDLRCNWPPTPP